MAGPFPASTMGMCRSKTVDFAAPARYSDGVAKSCIRCGIEKELSEFYHHKQMADGHLSVCKSCVRHRVRDRYESKRAEVSQYERNRNRSEKRRAYAAERQRKYRTNNPLKTAARAAVGRAIRNGRLAKMPCVRCGSERSQAHHSDYSKPLDVEWLCFRCHREHGHGQIVTTGRTWDTMG